MKVEPWALVLVALVLGVGGGIYFLFSRDDAAVAAEREYTAAKAIGDDARACVAAGEAAFQWQLLGNEQKVGDWNLNRELAC